MVFPQPEIFAKVHFPPVMFNLLRLLHAYNIMIAHLKKGSLNHTFGFECECTFLESGSFLDSLQGKREGEGGREGGREREGGRKREGKRGRERRF